MPTQLDHVDGNGLNNTRANLRPATNAQNNHNERLRATNTSGYKGVHWVRTNSKWRAEIRIDGRNRHFGYFVDPLDAARAYDAAARSAFGAFACLNFPLDGEQGALARFAAGKGRTDGT